MELAIARWYITLQKGGNLILENEQGTAANAVKTAVTAKATELTAAKAAASAAAKASASATAAATVAATAAATVAATTRAATSCSTLETHVPSQMSDVIPVRYEIWDHYYSNMLLIVSNVSMTYISLPIFSVLSRAHGFILCCTI